MDNKFDALNEIDDDTLARLTGATAAGIAAVVIGKKIYKKYKEKQLLKKYGAQEKDEHRSIDPYTNAVLDLVDINTARQFANAKK